MRTVKKSVYAFLPSVYDEWLVALRLLRLIICSFKRTIWSCQVMCLILLTNVCHRTQMREHKIALKTAKKGRIIYYVFSTNTANDLLVIVWIFRTFAPRINTRTALIALLIMSKKTSKFQLKIISKIIFLTLFLAIARLYWISGTHFSHRF